MRSAEYRQEQVCLCPYSAFRTPNSAFQRFRTPHLERSEIGKWELVIIL